MLEKVLISEIDTLYRAFKGVPKPKAIEYCPCCMEERDHQELLSTPLRTIDSSVLGIYTSSVFLTVGAEADFLYLLPRIIELACLEEGDYPDVEVIGRALGDSMPSRWPDSRREALIDVLIAKVRLLIEDENAYDLDAWMCAIAKIGIDVSPFLELIESKPAMVISYYELNSQSLLKGKLSNAFWEKNEWS